MKKTSQKKLNKGFTLIEMLIVIGILAVLAVTALLALNPGEAQKKSRDTQRLKDAGTLQAIIQQYLDDGGSTSLCNSGCQTSTISGGVPTSNSTLCSESWLSGINMCRYANKVPIDPANDQNRTFVTGSGGQTISSIPMGYFVKIVGGNYIICTRQESKADIKNLLQDSVNDAWAAVYGGETGAVYCPITK